MKRKYEMTDEQYEKILDSCRPVPYLVFGGIEPSSPQENANRAWRALGDELGFHFMTVEPGDSPKTFMAEPKP